MKICLKCKEEFEPSKGLINYCSLKCRNSRYWTENDKLKKSLSAKKSEKVKKNIEDRKFQSKSFEQYREQVEKQKTTWNNKILNETYSNLSFERLRKRVILEQNNKCGCCKIDKWNGKSITLELEHKDGNHYNNERNNLEALCPNCHSQTETWRGKNKKNNRKKISDNEIIKCFLVHKNIRQTLLKLGLAAKGGNYKRVHQLLKKNNLNYILVDNPSV